MTILFKELHKWPRGFKTKLAEHYGFKVPRCVLCYSTVRVSIDHYRDMYSEKEEERNPYYYQTKEMYEGKAPKNYQELKELINWDDLSKFVLLCGSCHSKIERMRDFYFTKNPNDRPPMLKLLDEVVKEAKKK